MAKRLSPEQLALLDELFPEALPGTPVALADDHARQLCKNVAGELMLLLPPGVHTDSAIDALKAVYLHAQVAIIEAEGPGGA